MDPIVTIAMQAFREEFMAAMTRLEGVVQGQWQGQAMALGRKVEDIEYAMKKLEDVRTEMRKQGKLQHKDARDVKPGVWGEPMQFSDQDIPWGQSF